ncbi:putative kinesin K39 [Rhodotorula diobovata]|uniref:Putative kinesin K39 n=1 Tax=Rhodotorula diobovata TaxID=5288 RepID=A0A5C5FT61_9BASI|nr:putative kinesin K39 [Rhodotorula diobovata]
MSLLRTAARRLGLGKYRYWKGTDLEGNQFFERPHPEYPDEWRKNKRYIEYAQVKPLSDYNYETIPVQWSSWLRRTRRDPPTLQELETDLQRQLRLRDNVARLEQAYRDEKLRLAGRAESARMVAAPRSQGEGADADADAEAGRATASVAGKEVDGLPLEDGGVDAPAGKHASVVARELDGVKHASPSRAPAPAPAPSASGSPRAAAPQAEGLPLRDGGVNPQAGKRAPVVARELREGAQRVEPNVGGAEGAQAVSAEEAARRRRDEEHAAALRRREEFAKQNPAPLRGNPGDSHQPQGWSPTAPARRR